MASPQALSLSPGLVVVINLLVTVKTILISHKAGRRRAARQTNSLRTLRNTVMLSLLLGLT